MTGRIEGVDEVLDSFTRFGDVGLREAKKAIKAMGQKVRSDAITEIQRGTKSGRTYTEVFATIGGQLRVVGSRSDANNLSASHTASAPGEAPATDTGRLVSSIKTDIDGFKGRVYSSLDYAFFLEYGTLKMEPRPFLNPALKENSQYFVDQLKAAILRAEEAYKR